MLGEDAAARDAVQEVFLRALTGRNAFRASSEPFTWLYRIATTYCLQQLRNSSLRARKIAALKGSGEASPGADERVRALALLQGFAEDVQQLVYLRHVDGLSIVEIAEVTGLSTKTVSRKLDSFVAASRLELAPEKEVGQ
jgi:RNA polymerase sigma-70 factor (ECF subfamily)